MTIDDLNRQFYDMTILYANGITSHFKAGTSEMLVTRTDEGYLVSLPKGHLWQYSTNLPEDSLGPCYTHSKEL